MQKSRNKYLVISLGALLLTSTLLFFFTREDARTEINHDEFKLSESEKIDLVMLYSFKGDVALKFEDNRWRVNSKWDADEQMIKVLFATLLQAEPKRPVANSMRDSIKRWLEQRGVSVTVSEAEGRKHKFLAGGNTLKTETWFLKEGDSQPYVMVIPGYRVYVAGILELDENGWRDKRIFDFNRRNFKSLTATYPKEQNQSFEIEMSGRYFGIKNMTRVDTAKMNTYLDHVSLLFAKRFIVPGQQRIDSLAATIPAARIEIKDIANRSYSLELFAPRAKDVEIYGRMGDGQILALERNKVAEIVRRREYFLLSQEH